MDNAAITAEEEKAMLRQKVLGVPSSDGPQDAAGYTQPVVGSCRLLFAGPLLVQETPAFMV